jgi:hypothetical protein
MTPQARAFVGSGLVALLGAALLHLLVLLGVGSVWTAMVHLTIFGWITAIILAVNYHTVPVFSGRDYPYPWLIWAHWALFSGGVLLAVCGLLAGSSALAGGGLALQLGATLLFAANTVLLLRRGKPRLQPHPIPSIAGQSRIDRRGTEATKASGLCLPLALLLLLLVQLRVVDGQWTLAAEHLTVLGWIMLMIVGVGYHVLPRFSGRGTRGFGWARAQLLCHEAALVLMVLALGRGWSELFAAGGVLMALAVMLFAYTIWPALALVSPLRPLMQVTIKERSR